MLTASLLPTLFIPDCTGTPLTLRGRLVMSVTSPEIESPLQTLFLLRVCQVRGREGPRGTWQDSGPTLANSSSEEGVEKAGVNEAAGQSPNV